MQITADIDKILKNFQADINFIFDALSESPISFISFLVFLAARKVVSFTKTYFYQKRGSITISEYVEMFHFLQELP